MPGPMPLKDSALSYLRDDTSYLTRLSAALAVALFEHFEARFEEQTESCNTWPFSVRQTHFLYMLQLYSHIFSSRLNANYLEKYVSYYSILVFFCKLT